MNCYWRKRSNSRVASGTECAVKALCVYNKVTIDRLLKHVKGANTSEREILSCLMV